MMTKKTCLIISFGPTPTPKYQKIEGGGMRCWGLALGLKSHGYDVTIGINEEYPVDTDEVDGIHLINWIEDEKFKETINSYDTVIINYSMGGPMSYVIDNISDHVTLVLDCYVPIYIEVSARDSHDKALEYSNYSHDIVHYNKALKRGDYFLCANIPQKHLYTGALSALGIINPYSYKTERVLLVPFGVESSIVIDKPHNPYQELGINNDDFTLLWFGGLYPWFNIKPLLETIKKLSAEHSNFRFVIVGGKNPYNSHPDFVKQYDTTREYIEKNDLLDKSVFFVDWVDFTDRINWYKNADVVISINNVGEENIYSWRTRVMDYVWGEIPMLTNGGDPLSDSLVANGAAILLPNTSEKALYTSISDLIKNSDLITKTRKNLLQQKKKYHWETVVAPIHEKLLLNEHPFVKEKMFVQKYKLDTIELVERGGIPHKIRRILRIPRKIVGIVKRKGVLRTAKLVASTARNRLNKTVKRTTKRYYFFSHPIDYTGAPLVLLDIVKDYADKIDRNDINLVYPGGERPLLNTIFKLGILTDKMVLGIGSRVIHTQLGIKKNDFVLMNTVAIYPNYRDYIFGLLETGRLKKATWFIHEDMPELRFDDKGLVHRVKKLIAKGLIEVIVPSDQTAQDYNKFFDTDTVKDVTLRVTVPEKYKKEKKDKNFDTLKFVISGTASDGRKGQLLAVSAFSKYLSEYHDKNPAQYRNYSLDLIAVGKEDYVSQQIRSIGGGLLKDKVTFYPKLNKDEALAIASKDNVTICCSINETFALFVAEGMQMGHILLRNKTAGYKEQIKDGKNGYIIDSLDINDFAAKIEKLLNKKTSAKELTAMSKSSQAIANKFENSNYYGQLN